MATFGRAYAVRQLTFAILSDNLFEIGIYELILGFCMQTIEKI